MDPLNPLKKVPRYEAAMRMHECMFGFKDIVSEQELPTHVVPFVKPATVG
jgi:hypothetical protein